MVDCRFCSRRQFCNDYYGEQDECDRYVENVLVSLGWSDPYNEDMHQHDLYCARMRTYMYEHMKVGMSVEEKYKMLCKFNEMYSLGHPEYKGPWVGENLKFTE